jgi:hypothetical protein
MKESRFKKTKIVQVRFDYDDDEVWDITYDEVREMLKMFNNLKREASIIFFHDYIDSRLNKNDDGKDK